MILGAVLAGGAARRFGSDKALALLDGRALVDLVIERLVPQCDALVVVGRVHHWWPGLDDRPKGGEGPLAGLNAALHHAVANGFDAVLTAPCDAPDMPGNLLDLLSPGPSVLTDHPVIGLWPATLAPSLDAWLASGERAVRGFVRHVGARQIAAPPLRNINRPQDLLP